MNDKDIIISCPEKLFDIFEIMGSLRPKSTVLFECAATSLECYSVQSSAWI